MGRGAGGVISLLCNSLFFVQCRRQKRHASSLLWEKSGVCWRSLLGREFLMNSGLSDVHFHRRLRIRTTTLRFPECKAPSVMCFHSSDQSSRLNDQLKAKLKADLWVSCSDQSGTPPAPKRGTAELIQPDQRTPPPRFHFQSGGNVSAGEQGFSLVVGLSLMTSSTDENTEPPAFRLLPLSFAFVGQTFSECGSSGREPGRLCSSAAASALHLGLWIIKWLLFPTFLFCSCSPKKNAVNRVFLLPPSFFISLLHQTPRGLIYTENASKWALLQFLLSVVFRLHCGRFWSLCIGSCRTVLRRFLQVLVELWVYFLGISDLTLSEPWWNVPVNRSSHSSSYFRGTSAKERRFFPPEAEVGQSWRLGGRPGFPNAP